MEDVLEVYHRPYDPQRPVVCMDEASKQLIAEVREPLPAQPGSIAKYDSEYERRGTANLFMAVEPLAGKRTVQVTDRRTKIDWAQFIKFLLLTVYPEAAMVVLVMDNLNTHGIGSLVRSLRSGNGSAPGRPSGNSPHAQTWQLAEHGRDGIEHPVPTVPGSAHRSQGASSPAKSPPGSNTNATAKTKIDWQFTTADARIKLKRLYPSIQD